MTSTLVPVGSPFWINKNLRVSRLSCAKEGELHLLSVSYHCPTAPAKVGCHFSPRWARAGTRRRKESGADSHSLVAPGLGCPGPLGWPGKLVCACVWSQAGGRHPPPWSGIGRWRALSGKGGCGKGYEPFPGTVQRKCGHHHPFTQVWVAGSLQQWQEQPEASRSEEKSSRCRQFLKKNWQVDLTHGGNGEGQGPQEIKDRRQNKGDGRDSGQSHGLTASGAKVRWLVAS